MMQYKVTGMTCAACQARVEKAVRAVPGVVSCGVSLLTNSMGVEGTASPEAVIQAVTKAGYGATLQEGEGHTPSMGGHGPSEEEQEIKNLLYRLIGSVGVLALLMYVSMGHIMWGWPLPSILARDPMAIGLVQLLLSAVVMIINRRFFVNGVRGGVHLSPNMDTLVALGSGVSFLYSTGRLFLLSSCLLEGRVEEAFHLLHGLYFESAAMILALITLGKLLEARAKGKTTNALKSLMSMAPETAVLLREGEELRVPVSEVRRGDRFVVRPGERIPVDGVVLEGESAVNEAALTGESIPVDKATGDTVAAATLNQSGHLVCEATRVGEDTTLSQIIRMVSDAAATKAPIAKLADRVSGVFVPVVILVALVTFIAWLIAGREPGFAVARGISVLVISCPCALGLATPVAIMVGNGMGAKHGILFKTAFSLENAGRVGTVVLDKTGTVTEGKPRVTDLIWEDRGEEERSRDFMTAILSLEAMSEHPLSVAIVEKGLAMGLSPRPVTEFSAVPGRGLRGRVSLGSSEGQGAMLYGGSRDYISTVHPIPEAALQAADRWASEGKTPLFFTCETAFIGVVAVADTVKEDSRAAIEELRQLGLRVIMLTGDNPRTALAVAREAGLEEGDVIAGVLPEGKEAVIRDLKAGAKVAMVGDGINDAPALTRADVGIAIGAGADVAIDAADVVLVRSRLSDVPAAIRLSRATLRCIRENLFWAFCYNAIGIPLAAGVFIPLWGWELNPMFGAAAMSLSSFCVVTNALRLNLFKPYPTGVPSQTQQATPKMTQSKKEEEAMKKTMKIEGMMCGRCEAHVVKALKTLPDVVEVVADHTKGTAVVTLSAQVEDDRLRAAVEAEDYKVLDIR